MNAFDDEHLFKFGYGLWILPFGLCLLCIEAFILLHLCLSSRSWKCLILILCFEKCFFLSLRSTLCFVSEDISWMLVLSFCLMVIFKDKHMDISTVWRIGWQDVCLKFDVLPALDLFLSGFPHYKGDIVKKFFKILSSSPVLPSFLMLQKGKNICIHKHMF